MADFVSPKKHLGQHFLKDENIAKKIVKSLSRKGGYQTVVEVGAGTGVLTKYLLQDKTLETFVIEIDRESVAFLKKNYAELENRIIEKDFLTFNPDWLLPSFQKQPLAVIGNFPYNISSQILFKVLEWKEDVECVIGMFQKEVAQRAAAKEGNKTYGVLSVLVQAFYKVEYLFEVSEKCFQPPPKVKSAVIRLMPVSEPLNMRSERYFFTLVKTAFNQRRKTLRNAVKSLFDAALLQH